MATRSRFFGRQGRRKATSRNDSSDDEGSDDLFYDEEPVPNSNRVTKPNLPKKASPSPAKLAPSKRKFGSMKTRDKKGLMTFFARQPVSAHSKPSRTPKLNLVEKTPNGRKSKQSKLQLRQPVSSSVKIPETPDFGPSSEESAADDDDAEGPNVINLTSQNQQPSQTPRKARKRIDSDGDDDDSDDDPIFSRVKMHRSGRQSATHIELPTDDSSDSDDLSDSDQERASAGNATTSKTSSPVSTPPPRRSLRSRRLKQNTSEEKTRKFNRYIKSDSLEQQLQTSGFQQSDSSSDDDLDDHLRIGRQRPRKEDDIGSFIASDDRVEVTTSSAAAGKRSQPPRQWTRASRSQVNKKAGKVKPTVKGRQPSILDSMAAAVSRTASSTELEHTDDDIVHLNSTPNDGDCSGGSHSDDSNNSDTNCFRRRKSSKGIHGEESGEHGRGSSVVSGGSPNSSLLLWEQRLVKLGMHMCGELLLTRIQHMMNSHPKIAGGPNAIASSSLRGLSIAQRTNAALAAGDTRAALAVLHEDDRQRRLQMSPSFSTSKRPRRFDSTLFGDDVPTSDQYQQMVANEPIPLLAFMNHEYADQRRVQVNRKTLATIQEYANAFGTLLGSGTLHDVLRGNTSADLNRHGAADLLSKVLYELQQLIQFRQMGGQLVDDTRIPAITRSILLGQLFFRKMTPRERSTVANHFGKLQQYVEDDVDDPDSSPASKGIKIGSVAGRKLVMDGHPEARKLCSIKSFEVVTCFLCQNYRRAPTHVVIVQRDEDSDAPERRFAANNVDIDDDSDDEYQRTLGLPINKSKNVCDDCAQRSAVAIHFVEFLRSWCSFPSRLLCTLRQIVEFNRQRSELQEGTAPSVKEETNRLRSAFNRYGMYVVAEFLEWCKGGVFTNHNEAFNEAMRFHDDRDLLVKALGL